MPIPSATNYSNTYEVLYVQEVLLESRTQTIKSLSPHVEAESKLALSERAIKPYLHVSLTMALSSHP